ncbi:hypothetical protein NFI96_010517, partial [Prochilodus magdalenae]
MESSVVSVFWPLEGVLAVACCLGNALVIWAVWTCGALRQPTFCFIVSLAVADLLVGLVVLPMGVLLDIHMKIPLYGCLLMCCLVILLEVASVVLLLAIAVDRFLRVRIPLSAVWVFLPFEVVVALACCLGNVLVIWAVWTCGALRQATFCFIVSLAVADFLVGSVAIPVAVLVDNRMRIPLYGCLFMCCVIMTLQVASVIILLAIAVDRFLRVYIPL